MSEKQTAVLAQETNGTEQISHLEGLDAIRKRPGMYIGSTSQKGVTHLVSEVIDNVVDEFMANRGDTADITVAKDGTVTVEDHGQGIPVGPHPKIKNPDGTPMETAVAVYSIPHTGGKFGTGDSAYKVSGGLHGVGVKAVNALSDKLEVTIKRGGKVYQMTFSRGELTKPLEVIGTVDLKDTGTKVVYHPDSYIFKQTIIPECKALQTRFEELVSLNAGFKINYKNETSGFEKHYYDAEGLRAYPSKLVNGRELLYNEPFYIKGQFPFKAQDVKVEYDADLGHDVEKVIDVERLVLVEIAWLHIKQEKPYEMIKTFANNINTHEGGFHLQGFRRGYDKFLSDYAINNNMTKEKIELSYLLDGIIAAVSIKIPEAEFEGQTKTKLGNEIAKEAVETVMATELEKLLTNKTMKKNLEALIQNAINVKEAEEAARKARAQKRAQSKVSKMALPGKLADISSNVGYSEMFIVEGDSAAGSAKQGRNSKFQAILPIRGKILNVEGTSIEKLLNSETIRNIVAALRTGIGKDFNLKNCAYDKIIIMTDADDDGSHIRMLLLTLFYYYARPLLEAGMVYVAQPPLYRVLEGKKSIYLKDDGEWKEYAKTHGAKAIANRQRFKGLGEMNPKQLWETTMNPATRTLLQIQMSSAEAAANTFKVLMGDKAELRRDFIESNAHRVNLDFLV